MEPTSANWMMANRLAGGKLAEVLADLFARGLSLRGIVARLDESYGISTTPTTLAAWRDALGLTREQWAS